MKPRIFISAVTSELRTSSRLVANVLARLGYIPVWDESPFASDWRERLRDKIDECDGLILIVGRRYGTELPEPDHVFGRMSYTQFEFEYAQRKGKKTWIFIIDDHLTRDLPLDPAQEEWRQRLMCHRHAVVTNDRELERQVWRLRDEFAQLHRSWVQSIYPFPIRLTVLSALCLGVVIIMNTSTWRSLPMGAKEPFFRLQVYFATDREPDVGRNWFYTRLSFGLIVVLIGILFTERRWKRPSRWIPRVVIRVIDHCLTAIERTWSPLFRLLHWCRHRFVEVSIACCVLWLLAVAYRETGAGPRYYGGKRGDLAFGTCTVSIPKGRRHKAGNLEAPSFFRLEFRADPEKHVVLLDCDSFKSQYTFAAALKEHPKNKRVLLFVHGFNVTFEDAARRTGQLAYDLMFDGIPMFFSWPSEGRLDGYGVDAGNSEWAISDLQNVIDAVAMKSGADEIFLLAHSMGNRTLTRALMELKTKNSSEVIREVILTAPDIDADIYRQRIVPKIQSTARRITMYASANDKALSVGSKDLVYAYPRAGDASNLVVVPPVETIDATNVETSYLGHSYYGDNRHVVEDQFYVIRGQPAGKRYLHPESTKDGLKYWVMPP